MVFDLPTRPHRFQRKCLANASAVIFNPYRTYPGRGVSVSRAATVSRVIRDTVQSLARPRILVTLILDTRPLILSRRTRVVKNRFASLDEKSSSVCLCLDFASSRSFEPDLPNRRIPTVDISQRETYVRTYGRTAVVSASESKRINFLPRHSLPHFVPVRGAKRMSKLHEARGTIASRSTQRAPRAALHLCVHMYLDWLLLT